MKNADTYKRIDEETPIMNREKVRRCSRLAAVLLARSLGYDIKKLRNGRKRDGHIVYPIDGTLVGIEVDDAINAKVRSVKASVIS